MCVLMFGQGMCMFKSLRTLGTVEACFLVCGHMLLHSEPTQNVFIADLAGSRARRMHSVGYKTFQIENNLIKKHRRQLQQLLNAFSLPVDSVIHEEGSGI